MTKWHVQVTLLPHVTFWQKIIKATDLGQRVENDIIHFLKRVVMSLKWICYDISTRYFADSHVTLCSK